MIRKERRQPIQDAYFKLNAPYKDRDHESLQYGIENISRGGLRFCSSDVFIVDDYIVISVFLDAQVIHSAKGRICYFEHDEESAKGDYYGLSFVDKFIDMKFCDN